MLLITADNYYFNTHLLMLFALSDIEKILTIFFGRSQFLCLGDQFVFQLKTSLNNVKISFEI